MLQKDPAKRPSVNSLLKAPLLRKRIQQFLSTELLEKEFGIIKAKEEAGKKQEHNKPSVAELIKHQQNQKISKMEQIDREHQEAIKQRDAFL